jgi:ABC-2 type transport system permease protein
MRAEWTKLTSLRSTVWSLVALLVLTVVLGLALTGGASTSGCPAGQDCDDQLELILGGAYLGQMAVVALGVLAITSEFATGMIRTTFTATPQRHRVLAAKAAVVGGLVLAVGLAACALAYVAGSSLLGGNGYVAANGYPAVPGGTVVRGVAGTAVYLAALALLSLGAGAILRHTAAAISVVLSVLWVPLIVAQLLPMDVALKVLRWCPMLAGLTIQRSTERADSVPIAPGAGLALVCAYAGLTLAAGFWLTARRDA